LILWVQIQPGSDFVAGFFSQVITGLCDIDSQSRHAVIHFWYAKQQTVSWESSPESSPEKAPMLPICHIAQGHSVQQYQYTTLMRSGLFDEALLSMISREMDEHSA